MKFIFGPSLPNRPAVPVRIKLVSSSGWRGDNHAVAGKLLPPFWHRRSNGFHVISDLHMADAPVVTPPGSGSLIA